MGVSVGTGVSEGMGVSVGAGVEVGASVTVAVAGAEVGELTTVGVKVGVTRIACPAEVVSYSMCRSGALAASPSKAAATRLSFKPLMRKTNAFPEDQSVRPTISCTRLARLGVAWVTSAIPAEVQAEGFHMMFSIVSDREDRFIEVVEKDGAFPTAWPRILRVTALEETAADLNWM